MIACNNLAMDFGARRLFADVQLNLLERNRYAVVGANGAGKSTLLKILAKLESPSKGAIEIPKNTSIGLLKQDHFDYENNIILDVVIQGRAELARALSEKNKILNQAEISEKDCYKLAELEEKILSMDGYSVENHAEKILQGLGIPQHQHRQPLTVLSGGYKLRVLLAQALFQDPNILLLDEPTNHLDIASIVWLESFLKNKYKGLLIFVSHDREFINNTCTHILDIDYETITIYPGGYDVFLQQKEEVLAQKLHDLSNKQQQIESMQAYADRFRANPSRSKQALSRLKMIERIDLPDIKRTSRIKPNFNFDCERLSGKTVLQVKHLSKSYPEKALFKDLSFTLPRGQRCAVIGPNGIGKSTLLKILTKQIAADSGEAEWSETVSFGYFAQDFKDLLVKEQTLLEWLQLNGPNANEIAVRKALGQMLFSGTETSKQIKVLSGGECARLIFAKLLLERNNMLILDEPTNHLDIDAIEGLANGLQQYTGTVLFVSHNRYLVQQVAHSLLVMTNKGVEFYPGTYHEYVEKMGEEYLPTICGNN